MKEIKAYLRMDRVEHVADALAAAGLSGLTIIGVKAIGAECDPENERIYEGFARMYSKVAKMEIVCTDEEAARFAKIIQHRGHTGLMGDGMIFIGDIDRAISIRTGKVGTEALPNFDRDTLERRIP